jgi:predicted ribosomally synthesized peptide with SipW-like signal peptide
MFSKKGLAAIAIAGTIALGGGIGAGTYAYFTSQATSTGNTITAGTLKINEGEIEKTNFVTRGNFQPGDVVVDKSVEIKNSGSLDLVYLWSFDFPNNYEDKNGESKNNNLKLKNAIYIKNLSKNNEEIIRDCEPVGRLYELINEGNFQINKYDVDGTDIKDTSKSKDKKISLADWETWVNDSAGMLAGKGFSGLEAKGLETIGEKNKDEWNFQFVFDENAGEFYNGKNNEPLSFNFSVKATQANANALIEVVPESIKNNLEDYGKDKLQSLIDGKLNK